MTWAHSSLTSAFGHSDALNVNQEEIATEALEALIDAAGTAPKLVANKKTFGPITQAMMQARH